MQKIKSIFRERLFRLSKQVFRSLVPLGPRARCLIRYDGKVLLVKNFIGSGRWTLPGGGIKRQEDPEAAVRREVMEELSIELLTVTPLGTTEHKAPPYVSHLFFAEADSDDFKPDRLEIVRAAWFPLSSLPAARSEDTDAALQRLLEKEQTI